MLDRQDLISFIENKYMVNVDHYHLEGILDCFCEDAEYLIQSAYAAYIGRDSEIKELFTQILGIPNMVHKNFHHVVDVDAQCVATHYHTVIGSKEGNGETHYNNCSFFYFENGKFKKICNYMSEGSKNPHVPGDAAEYLSNVKGNASPTPE